MVADNGGSGRQEFHLVRRGLANIYYDNHENDTVVELKRLTDIQFLQDRSFAPIIPRPIACPA